MPTPNSPADLKDLRFIAEASTWREGKEFWTVIALYYDQTSDRPFVSVVEGRALPGDGRQTHFRASSAGTLEKAFDAFDPGPLTDELRAKAAGADAQYLDANALRAQRAEIGRESRGYAGEATLTGALGWLYPEMPDDASTLQRAARFERDFGIPSRTARNIITNERGGAAPPPWVQPFTAALRFFDRRRWQRERADG